jgi:hypothetical protein
MNTDLKQLQLMAQENGLSKSGFPTRQDALNQGALDYTEYYKIGRSKKK